MNSTISSCDIMISARWFLAIRRRSSRPAAAAPRRFGETHRSTRAIACACGLQASYPQESHTVAPLTTHRLCASDFPICRSAPDSRATTRPASQWARTEPADRTSGNQSGGSQKNQIGIGETRRPASTMPTRSSSSPHAASRRARPRPCAAAVRCGGTCLDYALQWDHLSGVWGGMSERERRQIRRRRTREN